MEEKQYKNFSGAVILIALGLLFLLNTTGIVGWGIWLYIFRFWPLILILIGIKIMLPKNQITNILMGSIYLIVVIFVGLSSYYFAIGQKVPIFSNAFTNCFLNNCNAPSNSIYSQADSIVTKAEYPQISEKILNLTVAATKLTIGDTNSDNYFQIRSQYPSNQSKPTIQSKLQDGILTTTFDNTKIQYNTIWGYQSPNSDITIGQIGIPTNIDLKLGAGQTNMVLDETTMKSIDASVGAGDLNITLSGNAIPQDMQLEVGAGKISLHIPETVGLKVNYSLGLGAIHIGTESVSGIVGNTEYKTANYDTVAKKINITASVGVGELDINNN